MKTIKMPKVEYIAEVKTYTYPFSNDSLPMRVSMSWACTPVVVMTTYAHSDDFGR